MELHFVGTHHHNPRHRAEVRYAYEGMLRGRGGQPPVFIAVEADGQQSAHIRDVGRPELRPPCGTGVGARFQDLGSARCLDLLRG